ncbi:hypothetical protein N825_09120 [Skermanella stibiiresistens SB22]|uniref:DUF1127 domain-containing protein n=1 Tax=Skermanella stibiiresistens SB22 TaxID=1385369 RepID=W9GYR1_9PROT|nr:DUF1127 domain-containing protein [Skermanella stibiiresistens]EWY37731.1 hypothetical protein N825_09120 [Skermanella stibiiresistens SB22]
MKHSTALRHSSTTGSLGQTILNSAAGAWLALLEHRRIRRDYRYLMDADDTLLRDIGVTRDDIRKASMGTAPSGAHR